jgi:hypothetical protein
MEKNKRRRLTLSSREYRHLRNSRNNKEDSHHPVEAVARSNADAILDKSVNNNDQDVNNNDVLVVGERTTHSDSNDDNTNNNKGANNDSGMNHVPMMQSSVTFMPPSSKQHPPPQQSYYYTARTSAYVQHIAEVCHIIHTDPRWRTLTPSSSSMISTISTKLEIPLRREQHCSHCSTIRNNTQTTTATTLFSWEYGDDLSAVMAFASLYDNAYVDNATNNNKNDSTRDDDDDNDDDKEDTNFFESAMHLYSRMYHRKGPWFDIVDIFDRYYYKPSSPPPPPPAKTVVNKLNEDVGIKIINTSPYDKVTRTSKKKEKKTKEMSVTTTAIKKPNEDNVIEIIDSSEDDEKVVTTKNVDTTKKSKKRSTINFFTPRRQQQQMSLLTKSSSSSSHDDNHDTSHQVSDMEDALHRLFMDVLHLLSMGLIRTFSTEYECGDVIGNNSDGRRVVVYFRWTNDGRFYID